MVPGVLPLTSSSFGDVTSASATSALVSDTRAIGLPTSTIVERPTSSRTASRPVPREAASGVDRGGHGHRLRRRLRVQR